jgi:hypothetical protein
MKTHLILFVILLLVINLKANAQVNSNKSLPQQASTKYIFCELWEQKGISYNGNTLTKIFLNFGSKSKYLKQDEERTTIEKFTDIIDALDYMSENGWELQYKNAKEFDGGFETCYLFKRKK